MYLKGNPVISINKKTSLISIYRDDLNKISLVGKGKTFALNTGPEEGSWAKACSVSVKKMSTGLADTVTSNGASPFEQEEAWKGAKKERAFSFPDSELFAAVFCCYRKPPQALCASKGQART